VTIYVRYQGTMPGRRGMMPGIFALMTQLLRSESLDETEMAWYRGLTAWYNAQYTDPSTVDPLVYDTRVHPHASAWFKIHPTHLLEPLKECQQLLRKHEVRCERVVSSDPGTVIYEDEVQVIVVPSRT